MVNGGSLINKFPGSNGKRPWAVVTGCTAGIGEEISYRLAKEGYNMVLISRSIDKLKAVEVNCKNQNQEIQTKIIQVDLSKNAVNLEAYKLIRDQVNGQGVSILVNNAGVATVGYLKDQSAESIRDMALVNTFPYILLTCALLPELEKNKSLIVNLASSASWQPGPYQAIYACTKAFDRFFSDALYSELKSKQVEVLTVCPMYVQTNMTGMEPSWKTGATSCPAFVDKAMKACSNSTPVRILVGPPFHTIQTLINKMVLSSLFNYRIAYQIIENFCRKIYDSKEFANK
ncbi:hypothetical protein FGO68_gene2625 [Halteria grandinella]|uniref:Uncharacterized protein n=1 Tax=Halteria grandinella TaxID=5974 RepID=A0A8J8T062_HALGN|nr:hypothetical protein FGO68_gene2625 [Halteria grandinella]